MQEIRRHRSHSHAKPALHGAWAWLALIFGVLLAVAVWWVSASLGWVVVFLLLAVTPYLWRLVQTHQKQTPVAAAVLQADGAVAMPDAPGYWADWLSGWYWQTDAQHRLVLLKPDQTDSQAWMHVQRWVNSAQPIWARWAAEFHELTEGQRAALTMLETRMKAALPLDLAGLPWVEQAADAPSSALCVVKGMPRFDAQGLPLGYHGVLQRLPCPQTAMLAPCTQALAQPPVLADAAVKEAEQEMLRYALSHDLRAPLRVVDGFARILKEDYSKVLDKLGNDHLDRVLSASSRMNGMIDAILAQAQLSQAPLQRDTVNLTALAQEVATELVGARRSGIEVVGDLSPVQVLVEPGLQAQADVGMVRRVLENLIGNALKYSSKVGQPRIEVGMVPATDPEVYFVRDNGAGFDMQHAEKLFGLFQRLHSTKEFPGSGVGLAGVQNIVRRHGGRVWAEAAPGQGACFYFTLQPTGATGLKSSGG
jgi:signal transduction histidine kinase